MANLLVPLTIDDTSPTIAYSPFPDTFGVPNLLAGWNPYYTLSGFATDPDPSPSSSVTNIGNGTSLHITALDGAALSLEWNGTAITLHGTLTAPVPSSLSYTVVLDGTATTNYVFALSPSASVDTAADDILAAFTNLSDAAHQLVFTVQNANSSSDTETGTAGVVAFDRAVVEMAASPETKAVATAQEAPTAVSDDAIAFRGQWSFAPALVPTVPGDAFHLSTHAGDSAWIPFNGTSVTLSGLTTPASGLYNVSLDGAPFVSRSAHASFSVNTPTLLFYAAGLSAAQSHTLYVVNAGPDEINSNDGALLAVLAGGVNITSSALSGATTTSSSHLSRGAAAAIAIGVILAVMIVFTLLYVVWLRRRARRKQQLLADPRMQRTGLFERFRAHRTSVAPVEKSQEAVRAEAQAQAEADDEILDINSVNSVSSLDHEKDGDRTHDHGLEHKDYFGRTRTAMNSDGSFTVELPSPRAYAPPWRASLDRDEEAGSPPVPALRFLSSSSNSLRSPRPRGPREMHGRDGSRGILLSRMDGGSGDWGAYGNEDSPGLRVGFAPEQERPERAPERDRDRAVSVGAMSLPSSLRQALARHMDSQRRYEAEPGSRPTTLMSFLDFSSSSSRSMHRSISTGSGSSRRSPPVRKPPPPLPSREVSMGLSMTVSEGASTSNPLLLPDVSLQPVSLAAPFDIPTDRAMLEHDAAGLLPSPTDSIPLTVSDVHFRHSAYSVSSMSESRRTTFRNSGTGSHRGPHPPLPGSAGPPSPAFPPPAWSQQQTRPFIVQKLLGMPTAGSGPPTPFMSPTSPSFRMGEADPAAAGPSTRAPSAYGRGWPSASASGQSVGQSSR